MSKHVTMCDMREGNTYSGRFFFWGGERQSHAQKQESKTFMHLCSDANTNASIWEHDPNSCMKQLGQRGGKREGKPTTLVIVAGIKPDVMRTLYPRHTITQGRRPAHVLT